MSKGNDLDIKIDFLGKAKIFAGVSVALTFLALGLILTKGFNYGIDFAGGTEIQVKFEKPVESGQIRDFADKMDLKGASVQSFGEANEFLIRMDSIVGKTDKETNSMLNALIKRVTDGLTTEFQAANPVIRRVDSVGPQIGSELKKNGILAAFYCLLMMLTNWKTGRIWIWVNVYLKNYRHQKKGVM